MEFSDFRILYSFRQKTRTPPPSVLRSRLIELYFLLLKNESGVYSLILVSFKTIISNRPLFKIFFNSSILEGKWTILRTRILKSLFLLKTFTSSVKFTKRRGTSIKHSHNSILSHSKNGKWHKDRSLSLQFKLNSLLFTNSLLKN